MLPNTKGLPERTVLVALQEIRPGEEVTYDYGPQDSKKFEKRTEIHRWKINDFIKNFDWDSFARELKNSPEKVESREYASLKYIMSTPLVALDLIKQGLIKSENLNKVIGALHPEQVLGGDYVSLFSLYRLAVLHQTEFEISGEGVFIQMIKNYLPEMKNSIPEYPRDRFDNFCNYGIENVFSEGSKFFKKRLIENVVEFFNNFFTGETYAGEDTGVVLQLMRSALRKELRSKEHFGVVKTPWKEQYLLQLRESGNI